MTNTPSRQNSTGSNRGLIAIALALVLAIAVVIGLIVTKPWQKDTAPAQGTNTSIANDAGDAAEGEAGGTSGGTESEEGAQPAEPADEYLDTEAKLAADMGLTVGADVAGAIPHEFTRDMVMNLEPLPADSAWTYGAPDAPLTLRLYSDFSCPMCTKLHKESMPALFERADAGDIRVEFHPFVIFPNYGSDKAALAAYAAAEQGKLWEFVDAAYESAGDGAHPNYDDATVRGLAESIGLDLEKFDADYASSELAAALDAQQADIAALGFTGTPTMLLGSAYISGALPTDVFENTIDLQLKLHEATSAE